MSLRSAPAGVAWVLAWLESFGRSYRWWLNPGAYRRYRALVAAALTRPTGARPVALFDFRDSRIDGPQGRRFYSLFVFFQRAGYEPAFERTYLFLATMGTRMKRLCLEERYSILEPEPDAVRLPAGSVVITDRRRPRRSRPGVAKTVRVDYRPGYERDREGFPLPFPMFPDVYAAGADLRARGLRATPRRWRLFFGGDVRPEKYGKSTTPTLYRKVMRSRVLEIVREHLGAGRWAEPTSGQELAAFLAREWDGLLLVNTHKVKVPVEGWLETMARARFFLACPGVRYPMSHNVVEAMAVGTVPILEYADHFFPPLEDGVNCLAFEGEAGLRAAVDRAMAMSPEEMERLSRGAAEYYDRHLDPGAVVRTLLETPEPRVSLRLLPFLRRGGGYA